jgi:hypothetical protein
MPTAKNGENEHGSIEHQPQSHQGYEYIAPYYYSNGADGKESHG